VLQDYTLQIHAGATSAGNTSIKGTGIGVDVGSGYAIGIGIGRKVSDNFKLQLEWTHRKMEVDDLRDPSGQWLQPRFSLPGGGVGGFPGFSSIREWTDNFEADIAYSTVMMNALYQREITDKFDVFGGLGLGFTVVESSFYGQLKPSIASIAGISPNLILPADKQGVAFAWQLAVGTEYKIDDNFSVVLTYKYFAPGSVDDLKDLNVSSFEIGASYLF
jgi:opacity protein-like surface antigen